MPKNANDEKVEKRIEEIGNEISAGLNNYSHGYDGPRPIDPRVYDIARGLMKRYPVLRRSLFETPVEAQAEIAHLTAKAASAEATKEFIMREKTCMVKEIDALWSIARGQRTLITILSILLVISVSYIALRGFGG